MKNDNVIWELSKLMGSPILDSTTRTAAQQAEHVYRAATMLLDMRDNDDVTMVREFYKRFDSITPETREPAESNMHPSYRKMLLHVEECNELFGKLQQFFEAYSVAARSARDYNDENLVEQIDQMIVKGEDL